MSVIETYQTTNRTSLLCRAEDI